MKLITGLLDWINGYLNTFHCYYICQMAFSDESQIHKLKTV